MWLLVWSVCCPGWALTALMAVQNRSRKNVVLRTIPSLFTKPGLTRWSNLSFAENGLKAPQIAFFAKLSPIPAIAGPSWLYHQFHWQYGLHNIEYTPHNIYVLYYMYMGCTTLHMSCTTFHMGCTTLHIGCKTLHMGCTTLHVGCITLSPWESKWNSLLACYNQPGQAQLELSLIGLSNYFALCIWPALFFKITAKTW